LKRFLFALFLTGCAVATANNPIDAGVSVHFDNQYKWTYEKYYPACVRQCIQYTGSDECPEKCDKDFEQIKTVLYRALRDGREDDFYDMMDSWYGQN